MVELMNARRSRGSRMSSIYCPSQNDKTFALNEEIALFNPTTLTETNINVKNTLPSIEGTNLLCWIHANLNRCIMNLKRARNNIRLSH